MATGTATVSFGSTPASEASVTVTGQSGITTGSFAEAFMMGDSTSDNDVTDHKFAGVSFRIVCSDLVAGTGFTIYATTTAGLATGDFQIKWVWS